VSLDELPSGAKAHVPFAAFMYGLKPIPFKLTHYWRFSPIENDLRPITTRKPTFHY
jgi:hypothetical protein